MAVSPVSVRDQVAEALKPTPDCPTLETLAGYRGRTLANARRSDLAAHLAACSWCRKELALLAEFEDGTVRPDEAEAVHWISNRLAHRFPGSLIGRAADICSDWLKQLFRFRRVITAAGVIVLGAVLAVAAVRYLKEVLFRWRIGQTLEENRGNDFQLGAPPPQTKGAPAEVSWPEVNGAERYRVRILDAERQEIWITETPRLQVAIPEEVRRLIVPPMSILVEVTPFTVDRTPLSTASREVDVRPVPVR